MKMKEEKIDGFDKYEIEHLADKMIDIEKCKKDPKKMKAVLKCLKEKQSGAKNVIKSIKDIRDAADNMDEDYDKEDE